MLKSHLLTRSFVALGVLASSAILAPAVFAIEAYPAGDTEQVAIFRYHRSDWVNFGPGQTKTLFWNCPSNAYTVGGGWEVRPVSGSVSNWFSAINSYPASNKQWRVTLRNTHNQAHDVRIYNICAD